MAFKDWKNWSKTETCETKIKSNFKHNTLVCKEIKNSIIWIFEKNIKSIQIFILCICIWKNNVLKIVLKFFQEKSKKKFSKKVISLGNLT